MGLGGHVSPAEAQAASSLSGPTANIYDMFVHYNRQKNAIRIEHFSGASATFSKNFTLAVFYK